MDAESSLGLEPQAEPASDDSAAVADRLLREAVSLTADTTRESVLALYRGRSPQARRHAAHVAALAGAIADVARGRSAHLGALSSRTPARPLLDLLRTNYLARLASLRHEPLGRRIVTVLQAIDEVQHLLARDADKPADAKDDGTAPLDLAVLLAHDMRSPLSSVLFLVDALHRGHGAHLLPDQQRQLLIVYGAAYELSALVNDMLALARGGHHLLDSSDVAFSLHVCLQSVRDVVQPIAEERHLALTIAWPESEYRVGRPSGLRRVLLNLVTNALKFTETGTVSLSAVDKGRSRVTFEVSDTGGGVPPEVAAFVQEPARWDGQWKATGFSSTGLGLSVCHELLALMGSKLTMRSEPGQGTTFAFDLRLPVAKRL